MENTGQKIVVICGPTASGKTKLALQLAKELSKANILSVDSRQMYEDLDIITGKDIPADLSNRISVYGLNLFKPSERVNLADFVRYSQKIISLSCKEKTPLIIVGGTGLYLKAITENLSDINVPPDPILRTRLEKLSLEELQTLLQKENPKKYSSLNHSDFMNPRRLIRALEIASSSSVIARSKAMRQSQPIFHWIGLLPDKDSLRELIHLRVIKRINEGAIKEVENLLNQYPNRALTIYSSLGVSQIIDFLDKKISEEKLIDIWTNAEVDYARRQIVWFKKQPGIFWYDKNVDIINLSQKLSKIYQ
jgi:tRNA dimethylallyltransferase